MSCDKQNRIDLIAKFSTHLQKASDELIDACTLISQVDELNSTRKAIQAVIGDLMVSLNITQQAINE